MDLRHIDAEDEQFLLNMIAEGQGDVPEQADDGRKRRSEAQQKN